MTELREGEGEGEGEGERRGLPVSEHVSQTKVFMVALRVQIEKIRHVNIGQAELILLAHVVLFARLIIVDLNALNLEASHAVWESTIEFRVHINGIDGLDVLGNHRGDLFTCRVSVAFLVFVVVLPHQRIRLNEK